MKRRYQSFCTYIVRSGGHENSISCSCAMNEATLLLPYFQSKATNEATHFIPPEQTMLYSLSQICVFMHCICVKNSFNSIELISFYGQNTVRTNNRNAKRFIFVLVYRKAFDKGQMPYWNIRFDLGISLIYMERICG